MGRRDPDERPPIEVVGAERGTGSLQHVSTGPSRPRRPGGSGVVAAGVAIGLLLVAGLALGGDDGSPADPARDEGEGRSLAEDPTTTRRPGSTTTRPRPTTTTIPVGPVFGRPLGGWLLTADGSGWTLVDIDSGARRDIALPAAGAFEARAVTGGVVMLSGGRREAGYYDLRSGTDLPVPVVLGTADQLLPGDRPDRIWLVDFGTLSF